MVSLKTPEEIEIMAEGGRRLADILRVLENEAKVGVPTKRLERTAYELIHKSGAKPAFLNYKPAGARRAYPYALCVSVNDVVVHGQPSDYVIKEGDLVKLDLGLRYKGFCLDAAVTLGAGALSREAKKLLEAAKAALDAGIAEAVPGKTLGDIGFVIHKIISGKKFSIVSELTGHGIGRELHEEPTVFNFGRRGEGEGILPGMVLAIEPMVAAGKGGVRELKDESFATADRSLSAHFEHTVAITARGPRVLTA